MNGCKNCKEYPENGGNCPEIFDDGNIDVIFCTDFCLMEELRDE